MSLTPHSFSALNPFFPTVLCYWPTQTGTCKSLSSLVASQKPGLQVVKLCLGQETSAEKACELAELLDALGRSALSLRWRASAAGGRASWASWHYRTRVANQVLEHNEEQSIIDIINFRSSWIPLGRDERTKVTGTWRVEENHWCFGWRGPSKLEPQIPSNTSSNQQH